MLKKLMGILLAVLMALLLSLPAFAEDADGLNIHLSADQAEYGKKDDITVTLTVKNTNPAGVSYADIRLLNEAPSGYILQAGSSAEKTIRLLKAGEEATLTSVFHPVHIPSTGDQGIGTPLLIGGIALLCLLFLLAVKKSRYMHLFRSMMCLLLVISIAAAALPITAMAASLTIPFSTVVKVEGKDVKLNSLVIYDPLNHEPENSLKIKDILPANFPAMDWHATVPCDAWAAEDENFVCYVVHYIDESTSITFETLNTGDFSSIDADCRVSESDGNYVCDLGEGETINFVMSEGKLARVEHAGTVGGGGYFLSYAPTEKRKIAELLPDGFPYTENPAAEVPTGAWTTDDKNSVCYLGRNADGVIDLFFKTLDTGEMSQANADIPASERKGNYICVYDNGDITLKFVMSGENLTGIVQSSTIEGKLPTLTYTPSNNAQESEITIADILPDDFPTESDHAWRKDSYRACITDGTYLWFSDSINGTSLGLPVGDPVAESEGNYVYDKSTYMEEYEEYWGYKATFIMSEGKLASIEMIEYDFPDFTGTYVKPQEGKTLAEIIPADFPVTVGDFGELIPDNAWCTSDGKLSCKSAESFLFPETSLIFYADNQSMGIYFHEVATESEGNYILEDETGKITFVMTDGKLTSIEFADTGADARYNGVYMPPAQ